MSHTAGGLNQWFEHLNKNTNMESCIPIERLQDLDLVRLRFRALLRVEH